MATNEEIRTDWITDRSGLAAVLGVAVNHINKLAGKGMPRAARGRYDVRDCVQWFIQRLEEGGARDPDEIEEVVKERTMLYSAQRRHKELEVGRLAGELVNIDEAQEALLELAAILVQGLDAFPTRAAAQLLNLTTEAEAIDIAQRETRHTRALLCERVKALGESLRSGFDAARADAEADGSGMGGRGTNGAGPRVARGEMGNGANALLDSDS